MKPRLPRARSALRLVPRPLRVLAVSGGLCFGACHETANPREEYRRLTGNAGHNAASGGASTVNVGARGGTLNPTRGGANSALEGGSRPTTPTASGGAMTSAEGGAHNEAGAGGSSGGSPPSEGGANNTGGAPPEDACGGPPLGIAAFSREALRDAAVECARWELCRFESAASTLRDALAETAIPNGAPAAQRAFARAFAVWSELELLQFGPLASKAESAGKDIYQGQGLRELLYAWPSAARCRVEDQLISEAYADSGFSAVPISGRGLFALEYLLFYPGNDTVCAAQSSTARDWPQEVELTQRKLRYARALSADVLLNVAKASAAYGPEGAFRAAFVSASGYPDDQEALTVLAWALVYAEREVKDWKLGVPLGITLSHPVTMPETPFASLGTTAIRGNLRGFRRLLQGCGEDGEGLGFDDWLRAAGHDELAAALIDAWSGAMQSAEATPELGHASADDIARLYRDIKVLTDLLKTDLFGAGSPLNLKLPAGVASDTD